MDTEGDLVLNLTTGNRDFKETKRAKPNRKDRLKRKRDERRGVGKPNTGGSATIDENASGLTSDTSKDVSKKDEKLDHKPDEKRPRMGNASSNNAQPQSKNKFSSLFRNNPDIPKLENTAVDQISEKVFSNQSFSKLNLHPFMVSNLEAQGFTQATSVQMKAVPAILQCTDVLIKSQTGSGKTLAYAIPIIQHLQELQPKVERCHGPYAVVIVPTRELAIQTYEAFVKLVKPFTWIVPGCIMGGEQKKKEKSRLRKGINVLISTPGRLLDHLQSTKSLQLCRLKWMVIDEADRLLELGFEKVISQIILALRERGPENQQAVLLSATLSPGVERLAGMSLKDPVDVDLSQDTTSSPAAPATPILTLKKGDSADTSTLITPEGLRHHFLMVPSKLRLVTLMAFILWKCRFSNKKSKMLVFMATQDAVDFHHLLLGNILNQNIEDEEDENKLLFFRLHGDMPQKDRTKIFKDFSETPSGILLCTDVAARGLDLPAVRWIVQYTAPTSPEDYVHRAGRTARVGSQGRAVLFLSPSESEYIKVLNNHKISLTEVKMDDVLQTLLLDDELLMSQGQRPNTVQERATALQRKIEEHTLENKEVRPLARKAYQSYIRAYSTYPSNMKHIFHIRHLHLGHVAKSFGLQEAPTHIGGIVGKFAKMDKGKNKRGGKKGENKVPRVHKTQNHLNIKSMSLSEFSSGLGAGAGPVTKKMKRSVTSGSQQKKPKVKRLKLKQPRK